MCPLIVAAGRSICHTWRESLLARW